MGIIATLIFTIFFGIKIYNYVRYNEGHLLNIVQKADELLTEVQKKKGAPLIKKKIIHKKLKTSTEKRRLLQVKTIPKPLRGDIIYFQLAGSAFRLISMKPFRWGWVEVNSIWMNLTDKKEKPIQVIKKELQKYYIIILLNEGS